MNRKSLCVCFFTAIAFLPIPTFAAGQCYSPVELQAEQVLRLHSELMVIAVTCRESSQGQDLVLAYAAFTHDNIGMLKKAEQTLIRYYKTRFHDDGISHLDELRTRLGNESGQESANVSAPEFCRQYRDRVIVLYYDSPAQVQKEVRHMIKTKKTYGVLCREKVPG